MQKFPLEPGHAPLYYDQCENCGAATGGCSLVADALRRWNGDPVEQG